MYASQPLKMAEMGCERSSLQGSIFPCERGQEINLLLISVHFIDCEKDSMEAPKAVQTAPCASEKSLGSRIEKEDVKESAGWYLSFLVV